ncbi:hypothetical protein SDC9_199089 [bioreactor metagenome]|uniref:Uncharacterized protein n=1 Tax=bioreactor metagenome TaxID=1076179 RepID=A0A645IW80_9ZZZZ
MSLESFADFSEWNTIFTEKKRKEKEEMFDALRTDGVRIGGGGCVRERRLGRDGIAEGRSSRRPERKQRRIRLSENGHLYPERKRRRRGQGTLDLQRDDGRNADSGGYQPRPGRLRSLRVDPGRRRFRPLRRG